MIEAELWLYISRMYFPKYLGRTGTFCWSMQWRLGAEVVVATCPQLSSGKVAKGACGSLYTV